MAGARASWKGYLKLALLSCPIRLYKATGQAEKLSGHFLHKDTKNRISMVPHDPALGKVDRGDLVMGYACGEGRYVVLNDADLREISDPSDRTLSIESFVDAGEIDPIYLDQPHFLAPDGDVAVEMLDVLRGAMAGRRRAAIARLVMNQRERMAVLTVRGRGFLLTTLLGADEIRDPDAFYEGLPSGDPSIELLNLAEQLIAIRSGRFDPHIFKDRYQAALKALIDQKVAYGETADQPLSGKPPAAANDDHPQPPADLAEAFRQSIDSHLKPPAPSRTRKPAARKKPPAKPARIPEKSPG
ncbi:MAG: Ku protein [Alphaproteobacteria bacterium]